MFGDRAALFAAAGLERAIVTMCVALLPVFARVTTLQIACNGLMATPNFNRRDATQSTGLFASIMSSTIHALSMPDASDEMPAAAMPLCVAVIGGAIVRMATGLIADRSSLLCALAIPTTCYARIAVPARSISACAA